MLPISSGEATDINRDLATLQLDLVLAFSVGNDSWMIRRTTAERNGPASTTTLGPITLYIAQTKLIGLANTADNTILDTEYTVAAPSVPDPTPRVGDVLIAAGNPLLKFHIKTLYFDGYNMSGTAEQV